MAAGRQRGPRGDPGRRTGGRAEPAVAAHGWPAWPRPSQLARLRWKQAAGWVSGLTPLAGPQGQEELPGGCRSWRELGGTATWAGVG